jgi:hypothetical protein
MRTVLALLAILALLASPQAAAASVTACGHGGAAAMDMPGMPGMGPANAVDGGAYPCCDHSNQRKKSDTGCAQACAAACGVTAVLPSSGASFAPLSEPVAAARPKMASAYPHQPARLERPPKSIA